MVPGELLRARKKLGKFNKELKNFDSSLHPVVLAEDHDEDYVRQFLAAIYHERGIVTDEMVDPATGMLRPGIEIGLDRSEFFYSLGTDGRPVDASARLIHASPELGIHSLQMHVDELPEESRKLVEALPWEQTVEFGSLVKAPGVSTVVVMSLIREMLHYSHEQGIKYWLWGMEEPIANSYQRMFGDVMKRLGPPVGFGEFNFEHVPHLLNVEYGIERFRHPKLIERAMGKAALFHFMSAPGDDSTLRT